MAISIAALVERGDIQVRALPLDDGTGLQTGRRTVMRGNPGLQSDIDRPGPFLLGLFWNDRIPR